MMEDRLNILNKFISDIIDYSRNSRVEVVSEKILIKELVTEILGVLKNPTFHHTLKINIDAQEDLEINSDPSRLRVILNNLLHNAIKYADPSKENSMIWITASREGNACSIEIKDNGIGIATDLQPKIFEMFFRATSLSTGSGLGLYIVKESLEKLGGSIVFESLPGKGSTFRVTVPAQGSAPAGSLPFVSPESVL
jgi:signal transduction histidine kinase